MPLSLVILQTFLKTNFYNFKNRSYNNYFCNNLVLFFPSITKKSNDGRERKKIQSIRSAQTDEFLSFLSRSFFFSLFFLPYQTSLSLPKHNSVFFRFLNYHHISMPIIVYWLSQITNFFFKQQSP